MALFKPKISHKRFLKEYIGEKIDYDSAYGHQCIDLAREYCYRVLKPIGAFGGTAIAGWNSGRPFDKTRWKKIENKLGDVNNFPKIGDVIFFKPNYWNKQCGHVGIVVEGTDGNNLYVLEQNAGTWKDVFGSGLGTNKITIRKKNYKDVVGWFTFLG